MYSYARLSFILHFTHRKFKPPLLKACILCSVKIESSARRIRHRMNFDINKMNILRLIAFIPAFFMTLIVGNLLVNSIFYLVNLISSLNSSPLSFLWEDFLKSAIVSYFSIYIGLLVYPFKNRLIPLILFSLFYLLIFVFLLYFYETYLELIPEETSNITLVNQISIIVGVLVGVGGYWSTYIKGDLQLTDHFKN